jgi:NADH-quinone oxidoreductase subunit N
VVALCAAISFLSLTGIPPLAGFMAKYIVFTSALSQGYIWLVVIAIVGSVISIFYYFRPIINIYMKKAEEERAINAPMLTIVVLVVLTILSVVVGFIPGLFLGWL